LDDALYQPTGLTRPHPASDECRQNAIRPGSKFYHSVALCCKYYRLSPEASFWQWKQQSSRLRYWRNSK